MRTLSRKLAEGAQMRPLSKKRCKVFRMRPTLVEKTLRERLNANLVEKTAKSGNTTPVQETRRKWLSARSVAESCRFDDVICVDRRWFQSTKLHLSAQNASPAA